MMEIPDDLEPCPFCGGKAAFVPRAVNIVLQKDPSNPTFGVAVICGKCGAESANFIDETHAAERWNRRAITTAATPCPDDDHEFEFQDDSFDHEFGAQLVHYWLCRKCGETKDMEPGDYHEDESWREQ